MKGDFSRVTFDPFRHYARVLMQQGRVQLDADWNEQVSSFLYYMRTLAADFIGPHGAPRNSPGFLVTRVSDVVTAIKDDFFIGGGHYYVDGILCEAGGGSVPIVVNAPPNNQVQIPGWAVDNFLFEEGQFVEVFDDVPAPDTNNPVVRARITVIDPLDKRNLTLGTVNVSGFQGLATAKIRRIPTYRSQPDNSVPEGDLNPGQSYLVYLDVWERHVTNIQDDTIREVALGGPDTATRAKVVWQVRAWPVAAGTQCNSIQPGQPGWAPLVNQWQPQNRGMLKAQAMKPQVTDDPCITPPQARFRGENQLYRVEIHSGGGAWDGKTNLATAKRATFKWSRDNGSVALAISSLKGNVATLESLGRDDRRALKVGDWVEVVDDVNELLNSAKPLLQVTIIDSDAMQVTLSGTPDANVGHDQTKHPLLRRWDQKATEEVTLDDGAVPLEEDTWLDLEDGVQIQFSSHTFKDQRNQYRTGDYWLIPARTATGDVEWPMGKDSQGNLISLVLPPHGVEHHYAPLAIISVDGGGTVTVARGGDCRRCWEFSLGACQ